MDFFDIKIGSQIQFYSEPLYDSLYCLRSQMKEEEQLKVSSQYKNRCQKQCVHKLILQNQHSTKLNCQLMFCPNYHKQKNNCQTTFPVFNNDNKFYTSSFILQIDRKTLQKNESIQYEQFQRQINQRKIQTKLNFPIPSKSNRFCMICNFQYENYFQHIVSSSHRSQIEANIFTKQIQVLTQKFANLQRKVFREDSTKWISILDVEANSNKDLSNISSEQDQQYQNQDCYQGLFSESNQDSNFQKDINEFQQKYKVREHSEKPQTLQDLKGQNLQQDSIEIIGVKPAKIPKNTKKQNNKQDQNQKKQKKIKKKKKSKSKLKNKKKLQKKSKPKKKHKKSKKQRKVKRKKQKMKIQTNSSPLTSALIQNKMNNRAGSKSVHPPQKRQQLVLIQKNQIEDAELDSANQKILQNIVATINKGPPPQAPRQYRKAGAPIDFKIQPVPQINQYFHSDVVIAQKRGDLQIANIQQSKLNEANKILTEDANYKNLLAKDSINGIQQEKSSKMSNISDTSRLSINFQKIRQKADWQKLKNKLISSNKKEIQNQQDSKLVVISLDDDKDEQKQSVTAPKNEILSILPIQFFLQKQQSISHNPKSIYNCDRNNLLKSKFIQENNTPFNKGLSGDGIKFFKHKNEKIKIDADFKQLSFGQLNRHKRVKYFQNTHSQIKQKVLPIKISNLHLTRKYCDQHHQQVNKRGIIDVEIDQTQETQAIIQQREESFSNLPIDNSESFIKFIEKHNRKILKGQKVNYRFE